jgi:hypothetical protein
LPAVAVEGREVDVAVVIAAEASNDGIVEFAVVGGEGYAAFGVALVKGGGKERGR